MFTDLIRYSAKSCVRVGQRVRPRLRSDPRLTEAATLFEAAQAALEAATQAVEDAEKAKQSAVAEFENAERKFGRTLREFGMIILAGVKNHHNVEPYLTYFPTGYGDAVRLRPEAANQFAGLILQKLETETDPYVLAYRDRIIEARELFAAADN